MIELAEDKDDRSMLEAVERRVRARLEHRMPHSELERRLADLHRQISIAKRGG